MDTVKIGERIIWTVCPEVEPVVDEPKAAPEVEQEEPRRKHFWEDWPKDQDSRPWVSNRPVGEYVATSKPVEVEPIGEAEYYRVLGQVERNDGAASEFDRMLERLYEIERNNRYPVVGGLCTPSRSGLHTQGG